MLMLMVMGVVVMLGTGPTTRWSTAPATSRTGRHRASRWSGVRKRRCTHHPAAAWWPSAGCRSAPHPSSFLSLPSSYHFTWPPHPSFSLLSGLLILALPSQKASSHSSYHIIWPPHPSSSLSTGLLTLALPFYLASSPN